MYSTVHVEHAFHYFNMQLFHDVNAVVKGLHLWKELVIDA